MSDSTNFTYGSSFVFLNTVFITVDFADHETMQFFLDKGYIQSAISSFWEEVIVLYKVFWNPVLAQKEQSSLSF